MADIKYIQPGSLEEMLVQAAQAKDPDRVREILSKGPDLEARLSSGEPIFYVATTDEIRMLILQSGADVNTKNAEGSTLLHLRAIDDDIQIIQNLLSLGADVNARDNDGRTPLFNTLDEKNLDIVELLIASGANVNVRDIDGVTPLHTAVFYQNKIVVESLLRHGADVNAYDNKMAIPLLRVNCLGIDEEGVGDLLIRHGADVNAESIEGYRAIHVAAMTGDNSLLQKLFDAGAVIDPMTRDGKTPLDFAIDIGHESTVKMLQDYNMNLGIGNHTS